MCTTTTGFPPTDPTWDVEGLRKRKVYLIVSQKKANLPERID